MSIKAFLKSIYWRLARASLAAAMREQNLTAIAARLTEILPSVGDQYTMAIEGLEPAYQKFWHVHVRALHAFQVQAALRAFRRLGKKGLCVADVGDSSGNHGIYLEAMAEPGEISRFVSVNLDPIAVEKIRKKGREAIHCRAEELDLNVIKPDIFLSFETVEHLLSPISFIHDLATKGAADYVLLTVPYVAQSRFGGIELRRKNVPDVLRAETLHIFEMSPTDWQRMFLFAGFRTETLSIYRQYPRFGFLRFMQPFWKRLDFEGFAAFLLKRDLTIANRFQDWPN
jgi:hypothetical protein